MRRITRIRMRRAYNSGKWEQSRSYANKLLSKPNDSKLAKSVIIRSYWNEGNIGKVGELLAIWQDSELDFIRDKYENTIGISNESGDLPKPNADKEWNCDNLASNFVQELSLIHI